MSVAALDRRELRRRLWCRMDTVSDRLWGLPWVDRNDGRLRLTEMWDLAERAACAALGHVPIRDMCNTPDHDYCAYCHRSTPGQAEK